MLESERRQAFESLLTEELYGQAWRYASRWAATREDAEDLLQDSLATAYRKLHQLRDVAAFRPWLFSIVRSRFLNLRSKRPQQLAESLWYQAVIDAASPELLSEPIAEAMSRLPAPQSELLALFYLDGLTLEESGRVLGIRPQVVGQRLYRARRALRRELEKQHVLGLAPRSG